MNTVIMDVDVHMTCPSCKKGIVQKLRWLEGHGDFPCPHCKTKLEKYADQLLRVRHELIHASAEEKATKKFTINL